MNKNSILCRSKILFNLVLLIGTIFKFHAILFAISAIIILVANSIGSFSDRRTSALIIVVFALLSYLIGRMICNKGKEARLIYESNHPLLDLGESLDQNEAAGLEEIYNEETTEQNPILIDNEVTKQEAINNRSSTDREPVAPPRNITVSCKNCGAHNVIVKGTVGKCEYCRSPIEA